MSQEETIFNYGPMMWRVYLIGGENEIGRVTDMSDVPQTTVGIEELR